MEITIDYYKLSDDKQMGDGKRIPQGQELILIKEDCDDGLLFLETHDDDSKKLFWASKVEVEFVDSVSEEWSDEKINERNRYINGDFI